MADRYFSSQRIPMAPADFTLDGEEAHHLIRVMRVKQGQRLVLFDGHGLEYDAEVATLEKKSLRLKVLSCRQEDRELAVPITLAVALPKGERQRWLVEKAVELGVHRFIPLRAERSVVKAGEETVDRLLRMVVEATKQCGRNTLMQILPAITSPELFQTLKIDSGNSNIPPTRILAHPGGQTLHTLCAKCVETNTPLWAAIGPEGGFSESELHVAQNAGWITVDLGKTILRTETAAIKIISTFSSFDK